jgi:hypothetical protein
VHLELDAPPTITLEDQYAVPKDSVNDVDRSSVENDDLHSHTQGASKIRLQRRRHCVEGRRRREVMENGKVDIAAVASPRATLPNKYAAARSCPSVSRSPRNRAAVVSRSSAIGDLLLSLSMRKRNIIGASRWSALTRSV